MVPGLTRISHRAIRMHEKLPVSNRNIRGCPDDLREGGLKWYQLHRFCHNDDRQVVENGLFWLNLIVVLRDESDFRLDSGDVSENRTLEAAV